MDSINNSVSFGSTKLKMVGVLADNIGCPKTFKKAGDCLEGLTKDMPDNTLYMWQQGDKYCFGLNPEQEVTSQLTQAVGRDTMGYLLMEKGFKGIANFLKTMVKVLDNRQKLVRMATTGSATNANIDSARMFSKDSSIGNVLKTKFPEDGLYAEYIDLNRAGECIHVE